MGFTCCCRQNNRATGPTRIEVNCLIVFCGKVANALCIVIHLSAISARCPTIKRICARQRRSSTCTTIGIKRNRVGFNKCIRGKRFGGLVIRKALITHRAAGIAIAIEGHRISMRSPLCIKRNDSISSRNQIVDVLTISIGFIVTIFPTGKIITRTRESIGFQILRGSIDKCLVCHCAARTTITIKGNRIVRCPLGVESNSSSTNRGQIINILGIGIRCFIIILPSDKSITASCKRIGGKFLSRSL